MPPTLINATQARAGRHLAGGGGLDPTPSPPSQPEIPSGAPPDPDHDHAGDVALMAAIRTGDEAALKELRQRHWTLLCSIVAQLLPCEADVDETVQDIFLEVWRCAANFDPSRGHPLGWLVRMARRRAIDRHRRNAARFRLRQQLELEAHAEDWTRGCGSRPGVDESPVGLSDLRRFLERQLEVLPRAQREAVELNFFGQLSQRQIARHTGIPLGTIKTRLELALKKLGQLAVTYEAELR